MDMLRDIWAKQMELDRHIMEKAGKTREETLTARQLALIVEIGEFANELQSFKYWKHNKQIDQEKIKLEFVDMLHFMISIAGDIFVSAEELHGWYMLKNSENHQRQNDNY